MAKRRWIRVTKANPCQVEGCGHDHWCEVSEDGKVARCMWVKSDWPDRYGNGHFHRLKEGANVKPLVRKKQETKRRSDAEQHERFSKELRRARTAPHVVMLAEKLGVCPAVLDLLHVGWNGKGWVVPERNWEGEILGLHRRLETPVDGNDKFYVPGSYAGLVYADGWQARYPEAPILIVEGMSDTAAGMTLGFSTIGRASCLGGLRHLVPMLRQVRERRIVVVAERDRKKLDGHRCECCMRCWPGKFGAIKLAVDLAGRLGRRVEWQLPPGRAKDLRAFLNQQGTDFEAARRLPIFGRT